jgi:hypothetical protein
MTDAAKYRTGEIKAQIPDMPNFVVDVIAKQVQKEHIADDVHKPAVQKRIADKLPKKWMGWGKHILLGPRSQHLFGAGVEVSMRPICNKKNKYIDRYERIIHIRRASGPDICPNRKQHTLILQRKLCLVHKYKVCL